MISYAIMAHPARSWWVDTITVHLPRGQYVVVWDKNEDVWDTGRRAMLAGLGDEFRTATRHCVIQDDAIIARNFHAEHERMLRCVPENAPVSHYLGRTRTQPWRFEMRQIADVVLERTASFAVFPGPWWGVAITFPSKDLRSVVAYGDTLDLRNYDHRIAAYYQHIGVDCWYPYPSTVNHRLGMSLLGRTGARSALGYSASPRYWTNHAIAPADLPRRIRRRFPPSPV